MSRQNFISREFFVNDSLEHSKNSILSIPAFASNIKFRSENKGLQTIQFEYVQPPEEGNLHFTVSTLPLNDAFTRIAIKAKYLNERQLTSSTIINQAISNFELAIQAALKGDTALFKPIHTEPHKYKILATAWAFFSSFGMLLLKRKLS